MESSLVARRRLSCACIDLQAGTFTHFYGPNPEQQQELLKLASTFVRVSADLKSVEFGSADDSAIYQAQPRLEPHQRGRIDDALAFCDLVRSEVVMSLYYQIFPDQELSGKLLQFVDRLGIFLFTPHTRSHHKSSDAVLNVLAWFDAAQVFEVGHLYPLSTLLAIVRLIADTEPDSEVAFAYSLLNGIINLDLVSFGYSFAIDLSDMLIHLVEGTDVNVKAFYVSGVHAVRRNAPKTLLAAANRV